MICGASLHTFLDLGAMTETIASILENEVAEFANEMPEIESHFPGFTKRLRRQIGMEVRRIISLRVSRSPR